jgi:hypothetical protein
MDAHRGLEPRRALLGEASSSSVGDMRGYARVSVRARNYRAQALGTRATNRQLGDMCALATWLVPCSVAARHC